MFTYASKTSSLTNFNSFIEIKPTTPRKTTTQTPSQCKTCPDIPADFDCNCLENTFWNGTSCVSKEACPCVDGVLTYVYETYSVECEVE